MTIENIPDVILNNIRNFMKKDVRQYHQNPDDEIKQIDLMNNETLLEEYSHSYLEMRTEDVLDILSLTEDIDYS